MGSSAWKWAAPLAALVLAIAAGGVAAALLVPDSRGPREELARFAPADAVLYATLNLDPGHPQAALREEFVARISENGTVADFFDMLESEFAVSYADDVEPWIGEEIAFVGLQDFIDSGRWRAMARVDDEQAAADFLDYLAELDDSLAVEKVEESGVEDAQLWTIDENVVAALAGEFLVLASNERALTQALRDLEAPPSAPLAMDETYLQARAALPNDGSMFLFVRPDALLSGAGDLSLMDLGFDSPPADPLGEYIAASLAFIDNGVRVDLATPSPDGEAPSTPPVSRILDLLPADAIAAVSVVIPGETWEMIASLPEVEATLAEIELYLGIDVERDVFGSLGRELALTLLPSNVEFDEWGGLQGVLDLLLLAELSDEARVQGVLNDILSLVEDFGLPVEREAVDGREIVSVPLGLFDPGFEGYDLGYFIDDGMLAIGSTRGSLERVGAGGTLRDSDRFNRIAGFLPNELASLVYVDIEGVMDMLEGDGVQIDASPLSALLIASPVPEDGVARTHIVLTLEE